MNKKVWVRGFVFISFFLLVSCSLSIYAQDEDVNAIVEEEEEDIFYEVEEEEFLEETAEEEEIESDEGESLQPFKEVEEREEVITEKKEDVSVQKKAEEETEEKPLVKTEAEETEAEETEVEETEVEEIEAEEIEEKTAEPKTMDEGEEKHYTIRTWNFDRDCLWNIADHFYKNPWEWQKIWKANSYIENPDLIYEGDELVIPGVAGAVVEELKLREKAIVEEEPVFRKTEETGGGKDVASVDESVLPEKEEEEFLREEISTLPSPVEEEEIEEVEEQVVVAKAGDYEDKEDTFIAPSDWEYDGIIIRAKERKMLLSAYSDFVFIDCGRDKGVVYGMRFNIYRKGKRVKHPRTKKVLGIKMKKVGVLEVKQDIQEDNATAQIINAREPIKIGDLIKIQQ